MLAENLLAKFKGLFVRFLIFNSCIVFLLFFMGSVQLLVAAAVLKPIPLWPNGAPGEKGTVGVEHDITTASGRSVGGGRVIRLGNVSEPTITVYSPSKHKSNGTAVLVCPGGGYTILAWDLEGTEICKWLNSLGVTGVLLKYRVPMRAGDTNHILPLQDAQRAMGLIRSHAAEWNIDPGRVGVMGFSAGGHLMAHLCNDFEKRAYPVVDDADSMNSRPDFALGIYPAYLVQEKHRNNLAPELKVTTNTPPTFLVQAEDDPVHPECALTYFLALKNAHVQAEVHVFTTGGHGYGLRVTTEAVTRWPRLAEDWLRGMKLLDRSSRIATH